MLVLYQALNAEHKLKSFYSNELKSTDVAADALNALKTLAGELATRPGRVVAPTPLTCPGDSQRLFDIWEPKKTGRTRPLSCESDLLLPPRFDA